MARKQIFTACVTGQYSCERIVRAAKAIADNHDAGLTVVSVMSEACMSDPTSTEYRQQMEALDYLHSVCREVSAEMTVLYSDNPVLAVSEYIKYKRIKHIVTGMPDANDGFIGKISAILPKVAFTAIPIDTEDESASEEAGYKVSLFGNMTAAARA